MTNKGEYLGFTKTGVDQQETSTHEQASFERAVETIFNSAVFGERVPISSVTQSVFVGAPGGFGTNYNRVMVHEEKRKEYTEKISKISKVSVADAEAGMSVFNDIDSVNFSRPSLYFGDTEYDRIPSNLFVSNQQHAGGPVVANYGKSLGEKISGLPLDRNDLNLKLNPNIKISLPSEYTGNLNENVAYGGTRIAPKPVISGLVKSSVARIPGVPRLDQDVPYQIPLKSSDFLESGVTGDTVENKIQEIGGGNVNINVGVQSNVGVQEIRGVQGMNTGKGVSRIKLGAPKILGIPKPGGADFIQIGNLTDSKLSGVPITPGIPKKRVIGIPRIISRPEPRENGVEVEVGNVGNLNPSVTRSVGSIRKIAQPINLDEFLKD
jgi:hypothetical protein